MMYGSGSYGSSAFGGLSGGLVLRERNITSKARINRVEIKTLTAKGRINVGSVTKNITVKASIKKFNVEQNIIAKASIEKTFNKTTSAKARIQRTVTITNIPTFVPAVVDSYSEENQDGYQGIYTASYEQYGQSFTGDGKTLSSIKLYLLRINPAWTGLLSVDIYAHSGTYGTSSIPTGTALATSNTVDITTVSSSGYELVEFTFSGENKITLDNGTHYCLALKTDGVLPIVRVGYDMSSSTHDGNAFYYDDGSWLTAFSYAYDVCFYVYGDAFDGYELGGISAKARIKKIENKTVSSKCRIDNHKRYWVGGTGNWSDTNHWSYYSGGAYGATVPTQLDDVYIDSNSGFGSGGTISGNVEIETRDFICSSGHSFEFINGNGFGIYGSLELESGITYSDIGYGIVFLPTEAETIKTAGKNLVSLIFAGSGALTLQDDLEITNSLTICGTFDANDHNVTANNFFFYSGSIVPYPASVTMGSGIWEATGYDDVWEIIEEDSETVSITPETSTIKISNASENNKTFIGKSKTYNNIWLTGNGTGDFIINGSNTFNDFKADTPPHTIIFDTGSVIAVSSFNVSGTSGNFITIDSSVVGVPATSHLTNIGSGYTTDSILIVGGTVGSPWMIKVLSVDGSGGITSYETYQGYEGFGYSVGSCETEDYIGDGIGAVIYIDSVNSQFNLSKSSGIVYCNYLDISHSNATGGATWYAGIHSVDSGNNTGWIFEKEQTITAGCRITVGGVVKSVQAKVDIKNYQNQGVLAKASILRMAESTVNAKANIKETLSKEISAKLNIRNSLSNEVISSANIRNTNSCFISSSANIKCTKTNAVVAKAGILSGFSKTISSKASIKNIISRTVSAKSDIIKTLDRNVVAIVDIKKTTDRNVSSRMSIKKGFEKSILAKARIEIGFVYDIEAKARIERTENKNITSKADIFIGGTMQNIASKGAIKKQAQTDIVSISNIRNTISKTVVAVANIDYSEGRAYITGRARIQILSSYEVSAIARIENTYHGNIDSKTNIRITSSSETSVVCRIEKEFQKKVIAKARINIASVPKSISAKGDIFRVYNKNISSKARIEITTEKTVSSKCSIFKVENQSIVSRGDIFRAYNKTINSCANIFNFVEKSIEASANIRTTTTKSISAVARIKEVSKTKTIVATCRIQNTYGSSISAKCRIQNTYYGTVYALADIFKVANRSIIAVANIQVISVLDIVDTIPYNIEVKTNEVAKEHRITVKDVHSNKKSGVEVINFD